MKRVYKCNCRHQDHYYNDYTKHLLSLSKADKVTKKVHYHGNIKKKFKSINLHPSIYIFRMTQITSICKLGSLKIKRQVFLACLFSLLLALFN